jgi:hypothetical protein
MTTNTHLPVKNGFYWKCGAEGCHFMLNIPDTSKFSVKDESQRAPQSYADDNYKEIFMRDHHDQYEPGRAPDIVIEYVISACCTVCPDKIGTIVQNDTDSVVCTECKTTWYTDGTGGEKYDREA